MFTMAEAGRVVTDWAGDPGAVLEYGVRFSAPVPVPDDDAGTTLRCPAGSRTSSTTAGSSVRWRPGERRARS